jgi:hypothetical protein
MRAPLLLLPLVFCCGFGASCAVWLAPEGPGAVKPEASQRLQALRASARTAAVARAVAFAQTAAANDADVDKALELLTLSASSPDGAALVQSAAPLLERASTPPAGCDRALLVAKVLQAHRRPEDALAVEERAASQCKSSTARLAVARSLVNLRRCDDAVAYATKAYPLVEQPERVPLLDEIVACSDAVNQQRNLSFLAADERDGYLRDLSARRCQRDCQRAYTSCTVTCGDWSSCFSSCSALEQACRSGCHP